MKMLKDACRCHSRWPRPVPVQFSVQMSQMLQKLEGKIGYLLSVTHEISVQRDSDICSDAGDTAEQIRKNIWISA